MTRILPVTAFTSQRVLSRARLVSGISSIAVTIVRIMIKSLKTGMVLLIIAGICIGLWMYWQHDATGLYGVTRQLGSSVSIAIVGALLVHGIATETAVLTQHITPYSSAAKAYLQPLA